MVALPVFEGDLKEAADVCGGRGYGVDELGRGHTSKEHGMRYAAGAVAGGK
jgi:hypothetical protein